MIKNYFLIISFFFLQSVFSQETLNVFDIARTGTISQAKEIIKTSPKAFNVVNDAGYSPLILACYRGNNEVAQFIIENGGDVNGTSTMGTPLMAAVVKGNIEIIQALLNKKADVNASDTNGITALIYAVQFQNPAILSLLLKHNADKAHKDKEGKTAFEYAVFSGNETIINLLK